MSTATIEPPPKGNLMAFGEKNSMNGRKMDF